MKKNYAEQMQKNFLGTMHDSESKHCFIQSLLSAKRFDFFSVNMEKGAGGSCS
jgi:hypothetical protein